MTPDSRRLGFTWSSCVVSFYVVFGWLRLRFKSSLRLQARPGEHCHAVSLRSSRNVLWMMRPADSDPDGDRLNFWVQFSFKAPLQTDMVEEGVASVISDAYFYQYCEFSE